MRRRATAALTLVAAGLTACGSGPSPTSALRAFDAAVDAQRWPAAAALTAGTPAATLESTYGGARHGLAATAVATVADPVRATGATATAGLTTSVASPGLGTVVLHGTAALHQVNGAWKVAWDPATLSDALAAGGTIERRTMFPPRAQVLGVGGVSLTPQGVAVGLVGQRITDAAKLTTLLEAAGFPAATVTADLAEAAKAPTQLVPVGEISEAAYQALKAQPPPNLYSIAGTAFSKGGQAPLTPELGAHLVGTVGPVTAQQLAALGAPYAAGDQVGQDGIEAADEKQLAGRPAISAVVVDAKGTVTATLATTPAVPGTDVTTTIDPTVQAAAEAALGSLPATTQAAMVVERVSTGEVLASVSRPTTTAFDLALDGQVPPGSTFKVVTTADLLEHGATPASPATCPPTLTVNGQQFKNFEAESLPQPSLAQAFAVSCNTAFIGLAAPLPAASFASTAAQFGLGSGHTPKPGIAVAGSSVPQPASANEQAATAIGQAQVVVSPLAMASVAATAASGSYRPPRLVAGAPDDSVPAAPLPDGVATSLQQLMAGVVTGSGTAAGAGLPAGTHGKTGTAEFGSGASPQTHAWFIGYRGDIAFSVFVYGGGVGGTVAAPLAAALLKALPAAG